MTVLTAAAGAAAVAVAAAAAAATPAPTWWATLVDSQLVGVLVGIGASGFGAWLVRRHADRAAKAAAEAETQDRYRLQARRLLTAVMGLQEVLRRRHILKRTSGKDVWWSTDHQNRALAALRKVEARHLDMVLDCPQELKNSADTLIWAARFLHNDAASGQPMTRGGVPTTRLVDNAVGEFTSVCRVYFTGQNEFPGPPLNVQVDPESVSEEPKAEDPAHAGWRGRGAWIVQRIRRRG